MFRSFCFSPLFSESKDTARTVISKLFPGIKEIQKGFSSDTLNIASQNEVLQQFGNSQYFVTVSILEDCVSSGLTMIPFPKRKKQIASMCFNRQNIMLIGFMAEEGFEILKKIELMSGRFSKDFTNDVTVVVAKSGMSRKLLNVFGTEVPIVTCEWINNSFKNLTCYEPENFLMPCFTGMIVTSTDLPSSDSKHLSAIVKKNGGQWSDNLNDATTCVIATNFSSSKKIEVALKSCIPIVNLQWIYDSSVKPVSQIPYTLNWWSYITTIQDGEGKKELGQIQKDVFSDLSFSIHCDIPMFDELAEAIKANGGSIGASPTYFIVPHSFIIPQESNPSSFVTSRWIWDCICRKSRIDIDSNQLYRPLPYEMPVKEITGKVFALIELDEETRHSAAEAVRILGGKVIYRESKSMDYIVTSDSGKLKDKLKEKAKVMKKPFVSPLFVTEMLKTGALPDVASFPAIGKNSLLKHICMSIKHTTVNTPSLLPSTSSTAFAGESLESSSLFITADSVNDFTQRFSSRSTQESDNDVSYDTGNDFSKKLNYGSNSSANSNSNANQSSFYNADPLLDALEKADPLSSLA